MVKYLPHKSLTSHWEHKRTPPVLVAEHPEVVGVDCVQCHQVCVVQLLEVDLGHFGVVHARRTVHVALLASRAELPAKRIATLS